MYQNPDIQAIKNELQKAASKNSRFGYVFRNLFRKSHKSNIIGKKRNTSEASSTHSVRSRDRSRDQSRARIHTRDSVHSAHTSHSAHSMHSKPLQKVGWVQLRQLNTEYDKEILVLQKAMCGMQFREKTMATEWISRLSAPCARKNVKEARARNQILTHLIKSGDKSIFSREPFSSPPPPKTLQDIRASMFLNLHTSKTIEQRRQRYLNEVLKESYDSGTFLSQLPVPKDGAFFILHLRPNI